MKTDINSIIKELNQSLKSNYKDFLGMYLYGSYASGSAKQGSDIDIVAIFDNEITKQKRYSIYDILSQLEYKTGLLFDFHPMTQKELERNPLYFEEVTRNGIYYAGI